MFPVTESRRHHDPRMSKQKESIGTTVYFFCFGKKLQQYISWGNLSDKAITNMKLHSRKKYVECGALNMMIMSTGKL